MPKQAKNAQFVGVTISLAEACKIGGFDKQIGYKLARAGLIPCFHINKKIYVYRELFLDWLHSQNGKRLTA